MPSRHALYRCMHCAQRCELVLDKGSKRQLRCGICACIRTFERVTRSLRAKTWPPQARAVEP